MYPTYPYERLNSFFMSTVLDRPIHDLKVKLDRKNLQDVLSSYTDREKITDIRQGAGHLKEGGMQFASGW